MTNDIRILAHKGIWSNNVNLLVCSDATHVAQKIVFEEVKLGEEVPPTLTLNPTAAQELMDGLWRCGFRPSEGTGSAGALAATERHLQDMRELVFRNKEVKL